MNINISIIIVTYNAEKTLENAILSVINQSYTNIECLIIDGLSSDSTVEIARKYESLDNRVRCYSESDKGIYDAMNKGLKMAKGEWVHFLGADDELLPNGLQALLENSSDFDIVYGNTILKGNKTTKLQISKNDADTIRYHPICCHQSLIMRKEIIKQLGGFDINYKLLADYDLIQRAFLVGYKFRWINETISTYSICGASSNNYSTDIERLSIYKKNKSVRFPYVYFLIFFIKKNLLIIKSKLQMP